MQVLSYHWPKSQALAEDYISRFEKVCDFFEYNPMDGQSWAKRARWLDQSGRPSADRAGVVDSLLRYNETMDNAPEALKSIPKLLSPETLVIVGGQQAGLFGGPMLVMHKVITLLQAAKHASELLQRPVLPVFWIAGEDHDFDEVNHMYALTPQMEINKIQIDRPGDVRTSISRLTISEWDKALQMLDDSLQQTEFKANLMEKMAEFSGKSRTLVEFFGRMIAWLFGSKGLILLDSDDANLRRNEVPMFRKVIEEQDRLSNAIQNVKVKIEASGYTAQADITASNANLFVFAENGDRVLLYRDGDQFSDRKKERFFSKDQLTDWLVRSPERFSNNVMTRPIMQDYLLPVLGTVLGPGEIAYWALTKSAFDVFGMQMPIILPRQEFTLVEGTTKKHMDKFTLSFDTIANGFESWKEQWLANQDKLDLKERFSQVKQQFAQMYDPLLQTIGEINTGLLKLGETNKQKILEQIEFLESRASEANAAQFESALRQMERIRLSLMPLGKPQERVYNVIAYLNKYGDRLLQQLLELPYEVSGTHRIVYL